jgi:pimeloyl-ACP methyl ester carboxylesterase
MSTDRQVRRSCSDGIIREAIIHIPAGRIRAVAIVFHPLGFGPEAVLDGEAAGDRLIRPLEGFRAAADGLGLVLVAPRGRGRANIEGVSLAWEPHLRTAFLLASQLSSEFGDVPIVAGGLSQGGLEALVLGGLEPDAVRAVWSVNAPIDIARLANDIWARPIPHMASSALDRALVDELGAGPGKDPCQWAARTPLAYLETLCRVDRIQLIWSPDDGIVPDAVNHSGRLAEELRRHGATVDERRVTFVPSHDGLDAGRYAHESCDVWSGAAFLAAAGR